MSLSRRLVLPVCVLALAVGCAGGDGASGDVAVQHDAASEVTELDVPLEVVDGLGQEDAASDTAVVPDTVPALTAEGYCEAMADAYCGFYLRCGRMAVADEATCLTVFVEVCNAVYEPQYRALVDRGLLTLAPDGVAACQDHLEAVACALQPGDLDGPCGGMWRGLAPVGSACSYGVESLVCDAASTCVLGLDFCGTCEPAVAVGEGCGGGGPRCHDTAACVDGVCVARARPTDPCSATQPCGVGASCVDGGCVAPAVVGVGAACDQTHRCQYKAACVAGTCVATALLGEACAAERPCADGACDGGVCVAAPAFSTGCLDR
jgi:hypothetical protein